MIPVLLGQVNQKIINYAKLGQAQNPFFELQRKFALYNARHL